MPMIIVAITGMVALVAQMMRKGTDNTGIVYASVFGLAMALACTLGGIGREWSVFNGMLVFTRLGHAAQAVTLVCALISVLISSSYLKDKKITLGEVYPLLLWATLGSMMLCVSTNLLVLFVGIEVLSISLYILAGLSRGEAKSEEAAMKYFLLGAFATGFLLYGIAFFYGATGGLDLMSFSSAYISNRGENGVLLILSFALLLIGLGFKCSLVPFHQWTPDVYSGSPTNVVAFMATVGKIGPFVALSNFLSASVSIYDKALPLLSIIAILTMTVGNIMAFGQSEIKKLFAYSSIANAGYVLVAMIANMKSSTTGAETVGYFIFGYVLTNLGVLAIISSTAGQGKEAHTIDDLRGMFTRSPLAAGALAIFVLSLIGIGPVTGFIGKFLIIRDAVSGDLIWLAVALVLNSIFGAYYYFGLLRAAFQPAPEGEVQNPTPLYRGTLVVCLLGVVGGCVFFPFVIQTLGLR
jgi:NADH-quinone oxidoreductase subunit N